MKKLIKKALAVVVATPILALATVGVGWGLAVATSSTQGPAVAAIGVLVAGVAAAVGVTAWTLAERVVG